jgi:hypothetical protein
VRKHLVTTFHCADCGNEMEMPLPHEVKEGVKAKEAHYLDDDGRPKACNALRNQIFITPCRVCKGKYEEPVKAMAKALEGIALFKDSE